MISDDFLFFGGVVFVYTMDPELMAFRTHD